MFSDGCVYEGNEFLENSSGVAVMYTKRVRMLDNLFQDNWGGAAFGLLLKDITDSEIRGNRFVRNTVAIYAEGSNRLTVEENELRENGWAVKIMANSQDNRFSRNDFFGNTFDVATNSRRAYSTFQGNYWDNYQGYDLDRDGVGDVPFHPVRLFSLIAEQNEPVPHPSPVLLRRPPGSGGAAPPRPHPRDPQGRCSPHGPGGADGPPWLAQEGSEMISIQGLRSPSGSWRS